MQRPCTLYVFSASPAGQLTVQNAEPDYYTWKRTGGTGGAAGRRIECKFLIWEAEGSSSQVFGEIFTNMEHQLPDVAELNLSEFCGVTATTSN